MVIQNTITSQSSFANSTKDIVHRAIGIYNGGDILLIRYEVEKQVKDINKALSLLALSNCPNMQITKEDKNYILTQAKPCMELIMQILANKNMTIQELYKELQRKESEITCVCTANDEQT